MDLMSTVRKHSLMCKVLHSLCIACDCWTCMSFYYQRDACPCCRMDPRDARVASMDPRDALAAPKEMPAMPKAMPALMPMPKACLTSGPHVTRHPESLAHLQEPKRTRVKEQPDSTDNDTEQPVGTKDDMDKWPDEKGTITRTMTRMTRTMARTRRRLAAGQPVLSPAPWRCPRRRPGAAS